MRTRTFRICMALMCILMLLCGNVYAAADYTIDVPNYYHMEEEGVYTSESLMVDSKPVFVVFSIATQDISESQGDPFSDGSIQNLLDDIETKTNEYANTEFVEYTYHYVTEEITDDKYKGIEISYKIKVNGTVVYVKDYYVFTNDKLYVLEFIADDEIYFHKELDRETIDGFEIVNYQPYDEKVHSYTPTPIAPIEEKQTFMDILMLPFSGFAPYIIGIFLLIIVITFKIEDLKTFLGKNKNRKQILNNMCNVENPDDLKRLFEVSAKELCVGEKVMTADGKRIKKVTAIKDAPTRVAAQSNIPLTFVADKEKGIVYKLLNVSDAEKYYYPIDYDELNRFLQMNQTAFDKYKKITKETVTNM